MACICPHLFAAHLHAQWCTCHIHHSARQHGIAAQREAPRAGHACTHQEPAMPGMERRQSRRAPGRTPATRPQPIAFGRPCQNLSVRICLSEFVCDVMRPRSNAWTARHARTGQHARRGVLHVRRPAHRASQDITPTSSSLSATAPLLGLLSDANLSPSPASIFFLARLPALIKSRHTHGRSTEPARVDPGARQNNSPGP